MDRDVHSFFTDAGRTDVRPVYLVTEEGLQAWLDAAPESFRRWASETDFRAKRGNLCVLPSGDGRVGGALLGVGSTGAGLRDAASLADRLPGGVYRLETGGLESVDLWATGWAVGQYQFVRYLSEPSQKTCLLSWPEGADRAAVCRAAQADRLVRDLVNTPASDMGPADLEAAARQLAEEFAAGFSSVVGDDLLSAGFPAIHAVGRASSTPPRLIELTWGEPDRPLLVLVGKGVCFDTGGLDIKPASAMRHMKKDMGGAAHVLGLARMIMAAELPVRLRVLIPAVENSISGNAYRPGDILATRKGLSVEIGNTDAEGRIVLCDALTLADEERPDLIINMATLTGAARVALGPELPALYGDDDEAARQLADICAAEQDPVWHMPLWQPYAEGLSSPVADMNHISSAPMAGSIVAALYLKRFVENAAAFFHLDLFAWNPKARPGRPEGAECQSVRGLFRFIRERYASD